MVRSGNLELHPAIYDDWEIAGASGKASPISLWCLHQSRTRRKPWLREVGVAERRLVRTSRDVMSGLSSRLLLHRVLYFPHRHLWIMEYSCKERADVWWASLLRTRFEDGVVDVSWDEFVRLFRAKFVLEHIQDRME
ncbi:hypothetical protein Taro_006361 [Colocasia esculenta]|uniref:Uncharacterized protein n=1 Tax=Colocasia esculenta TaxID=4460 RepID=A0A843TV32_COLES|nr:hypothetical protein [Colocasia esculenta]